MKLINTLTDLCHISGVKNAIISPGSRNAPLTAAFVRHPKIETKIIFDERSAAFIGLGIAQQSDSPVVLICTSGTAALNLGPAVAEAFYQNIPLVILTADRPPEWINQQDGQSIDQTGLYQGFIKYKGLFPVDHSHPDTIWYAERIFSDALNATMAYPKGPVHINIPFREPFYPMINKDKKSDYSPTKAVKKIHSGNYLTDDSWNEIITDISSYRHILVIAGQGVLTADLKNHLSKFLNCSSSTLIGDVISNVHMIKDVVQHVDLILSGDQIQDEAEFKPELIITFGLSVLSNKLKIFMRKCKNLKHWHIQQSGQVPDPYQSLTKIIQVEPEIFLKKISESIKITGNSYHSDWKLKNEKMKHFLGEHKTLESTFSELSVVKRLMHDLPDYCYLHLGNSMAVRYANIFGLQNPSITVFSNRGTSGIDGSVSTAMGHALVCKEMQVLLIGDMSFLYDKNAWWHNYIPDNMRILVLNNGGAGIFDIIEGPNLLPEKEEYFITRQTKNAQLLAQEYGLDYYPVKNMTDFDKHLEYFLSDTGPSKIMEVFSNMEINTKIYSQIIQTNMRTK